MSQNSMKGLRNGLISAALMLVSFAICLVAAEGILRVKNASMTNYDIEMWRYSNELKKQSEDPALDFDHVKSKSALLQSIDIRINSDGLRGPEVTPQKPGERRILFIGGSITLGWGVAEDQTITARVEKAMNAAGEPAQVLNGGVGNYNSERYVSRFFKELTGLKPTDIVVQYFLRDAEQLPPGGGNWFLRNSQLAVTLWIAWHRLFDKQGEASLVDHYRKVYDPNAPGFKVARAKLKELADYARANNIRLYFAMVPDVHNLIDYKFGFVHDQMRKIATDDGYTFVDLLPGMLGVPPEKLWAMPGDPHPGSFGHELMAKGVLPVLSPKAAAASTAKAP